MGRGQAGGTARSGPRANVNPREIDHNKRNSNTGEELEVTIERCASSTHKVALKGMVWNEGFEVLVHGRATWWFLGENANGHGPGWVQAWAVGDGGQIEQIPLFRY